MASMKTRLKDKTGGRGPDRSGAEAQMSESSGLHQSRGELERSKALPAAAGAGNSRIQ